MTQKQEIFTLIGGRVKMRRGVYNPTSDAVWLAAAAANVRAKTILDVGVGTGGVALCIAAHNPAAVLVGVDVSDKMLAAAGENAELNNVNIELINADIITWRTSRTFDMVVSNPPYFRGTPAAHNAHHNADIFTWMRRCAARVRPRGMLCTIIDAATMADAIAAMHAAHMGDINIYPLFGGAHVAERVIIRARAGVRGGAVIHHWINMGCELVLRDGLTLDDALTTLTMK